LAFFCGLVHLIGCNEYRGFDVGLARPVSGKRDGRGAYVVRKIDNGKNVGLAEGKIKSLYRPADRFEELLCYLFSLGAASFC